MTQVLLATNNAKKLVELRRVCEHEGIEVLGLADVPSYPEPAETEDTFAGNALLKARAGMRASGLATLADDSGLAVDVLNQMPGVRSARWSGPEATDEDNLQLLLRQVSDVDEVRRGARFVCALALVLPDGREQVTHGEMPGSLTFAPRGENGFGYDPIFLPEGEQRTAAELPPQEKDAISHRGRAIRAMVPVLRDLLGDAVNPRHPRDSREPAPASKEKP